MKNILLFLMLLFPFFNCHSQSVKLKIRNIPAVLCGDSIELTADLTVEPVTLSLETLGYGPDDIHLKVVDKPTLKVCKDLNIHVSTKLDTILDLQKGEYYLLWVNGGANLKNPVINCKSGLWTVTDSMVQLEFKVDSMIDPAKVIYKWKNSNLNSNSIYIVPLQTQFISVSANTSDGYEIAVDSIKVSVYPYEPFINESRIWKYVQTLYLLKSTNANYRIKLGYFKGDSTINADKYKKFYCKSYYPNHPNKDTVTTLSYLFREDTAQRKVYVKDLQFNTYSLLYDFSLKVGDEFNIYVLDDIYIKAKVVRIEDYKVHNKNLKKIVFDDSVIWIEGIGSITRNEIPFEGDLICAIDKDSVLYLNSIYNDCNPVFIQDPWEIKESRGIEIEIFPNPINVNSIIRLKNNSAKHTVEIFNYQGKLIKSDDNLEQYSIGKLKLTKGIYFIRIKTSNLISYNRRIIVD